MDQGSVCVIVVDCCWFITVLCLCCVSCWVDKCGFGVFVAVCVFMLLRCVWLLVGFVLIVLILLWLLFCGDYCVCFVLEWVLVTLVILRWLLLFVFAFDSSLILLVCVCLFRLFDLVFVRDNGCCMYVGLEFVLFLVYFGYSGFWVGVCYLYLVFWFGCLIWFVCFGWLLALMFIWVVLFECGDLVFVLVSVVLMFSFA